MILMRTDAPWELVTVVKSPAAPAAPSGPFPRKSLQLATATGPCHGHTSPHQDVPASRHTVRDAPSSKC